jgi:hypothetical protein
MLAVSCYHSLITHGQALLVATSSMTGEDEQLRLNVDSLPGSKEETALNRDDRESVLILANIRESCV